MSEKIKAGDVVVLKSGGPLMTVKEVGRDSMSDKTLVWCTWFDEKKAINGHFPIEAVQISEH